MALFLLFMELIEDGINDKQFIMTILICISAFIMGYQESYLQQTKNE
jgi:hypothetical protein